MNLNHALSIETDFTVGQSILKSSTIALKAKELGYESVAVIDEMSVNGLMEISQECAKHDIRPILGCRLAVYDDAQYRKPSKASGIAEIENNVIKLKVYVKSEKGLRSLLRLLSKANTAENFYYNSRTDLKSVLELEDVVVTSGDFYSLFSHHQHHLIAKKLHDYFGDDFYVELSTVNTPLFDRMNELALKFALKTGANTLVTRPIRYLENADADALDVMSAIASNTKMSASYRPKQFVKDLSFISGSDLKAQVNTTVKRVHTFNLKHDNATVDAWKKGLANIEQIANKALYTFEKQKPCLPSFGHAEFALLCDKCKQGWKKRFSGSVLGHSPTAIDLKEIYMPRMAYELSVLKKMGFESYFLLVEDLVTWSKNNGVNVGVARGSAGGSLVAYLLGITDIDPIRFGLIFERFINPERLDLPDVDLDFASSQRHRTVEYLVNKYGADRVAGISNYSTLASASALRDVGRIFDLSALDLAPTKLVVKVHGESLSLDESAKLVPELDKFKSTYPEIWSHAVKLSGANKSYSQHAAGVVVAGEPISNRAVVESRSESAVVNWDKRHVESWGLIKMDLLGLATLDTLDIAKQYIKDRHGIELDLLKISLDDVKTLEALGRGETTAVFQLESGGMRNLLKNLAKAGTLSFDDIVACTALYRPGPMDAGLMDDYIAVRQGLKAIEYDHPSMEDALKETLGVIIYQEQVMKVSVDFAGFTNIEADKLRKAMGKKNLAEMTMMHDKFTKGAVDKWGVELSFAAEIFNKIESFAGYGFNKSHAAAYSIISFWTAYIRVHYPAEYFAASLSIVGEDKLSGLVKDAREYGIEVMPPDINLSTDRFIIPDAKTILAPFNAVKGVSEKTAQAIVALRENHHSMEIVKYTKKKDGTKEPVYGYTSESKPKAKFDSLEEFATVAGFKNSKVNSTAVNNLNSVGAFAHVESSQLSPQHFERRKDQIELMGGLIIDAVKADRQTDVKDPIVRARLIDIVQDYKSCQDCSLKSCVHPNVRATSTIKYMVVTDCPTWEEEKKEKLMEGQVAKLLKEAIVAAGVEPRHGYYTTLVKARKTDKFLTNEQINGCKQFLDREIELLNPSVIVALGSASIRRFLPKMKASEAIGKSFYDPSLDATIICGINPAQMAFDPTKVESLAESFVLVADVLS